MKTIILAGGQGTRLREETEYRPKPLVEIGGHPILWHIMKLYDFYGFRDFGVALGYRGNMIKEYFLNYEAMNNDFSINLGHRHTIDFHDRHEEQDFRVTLADTSLDSQTGARVAKMKRYVEGDTFMVTYGDGLSDINIEKLLEFHRSHGKLATVSTVRPSSRYGILELNDANEVVDFNEKPQLDGWVSMGFFVFERGVFDFLTEDPACILEREPMERLASEGQLMAYRHESFFYAMDTYREYLQLQELWNDNRAPWAVWRGK